MKFGIVCIVYDSTRWQGSQLMIEKIKNNLCVKFESNFIQSVNFLPLNVKSSAEVMKLLNNYDPEDLDLVQKLQSMLQGKSGNSQHDNCDACSRMTDSKLHLR